jgi:hypothetical protein
MMDIQVIHTLKSMEEAGRLSAENVVDEARDETSVLHTHFTWDDSEAADAYRLIEARQLIRHVKLEVIVREIPLNVVRFVQDPAEPGFYRDIGTIKPSETEVARRIVAEEMMKVVRASKRARNVAAVLGTAADVEEIIRIANTVRQNAEITDQPGGEA